MQRGTTSLSSFMTSTTASHSWAVLVGLFQLFFQFPDALLGRQRLYVHRLFHDHSLACISAAARVPMTVLMQPLQYDRGTQDANATLSLQITDLAFFQLLDYRQFKGGTAFPLCALDPRSS
ncbi:hypothetical protein CI15_10115 [Paraburkholderia monticola]|uniref:Uncharacterized protein n=1 Tax=Paraburkholderia monticola TaxID=1399968 RepID=A0A149PV90_9BURK|nr:hypothetical protein CI15_10115 [Paraburkholderia monticola]